MKEMGVNMVELEILGWDNGFGNEKGFTVISSKKYKEEDITLEEKLMGLNLEEKKQGIKKFRFPSVHMELISSGSMSNSFANDFSLNKIDIEFNGKEYLFGDYAIQQDPKGGIKDFNPLKYKHDTEIAKLCAGLALMFPEDNRIVIQNLILGVSLRVYSKAIAKDVINTYKDKVFEFSIPRLSERTGEIRKKKIMLEIQNVDVLPQGIGATQDMIFDINGQLIDEGEIMELRFGVIDIGSNTVDGFIRDGYDPVEDSDFYMEHGTSDVYKRVAKQLGILNRQNAIEMLSVQGKVSIFHNGQEKTFKNKVDNAFGHFADEIYQMAYDRWNRFLETVHKIILCGGCSEMVKEHFIDAFKPVKVMVPQDPQFANARGYYKYGFFRLRG